MARCRGCGAEILWALNGSGKREPVDAEPIANGNIEIEETLVDGEGRRTPLIRHLKKGEIDTLFEPPPRYVSHFSSCPQAAKHRRSA